MSALGQKRTYAVHQLMSALPPIATAKADFRKSSCLLYPRKRTCSALDHVCYGPKADIALGVVSRHSYSMISSAIESTPDGTVSPNAFAVFRLSTSSNFVDWLTGTSAGFSPLRIRPV